MTANEGKGIITRLSEIEDKLNIVAKTKDDKKLKKSFKLPFKVKNYKVLVKKNKIPVLLLQESKNIMPTVGELKNGMLIVGKQIYNGAQKYQWMWNGKHHCIIVPEWDLNPLESGQRLTLDPIDAGALQKDAEAQKRLAYPQRIILRAMEYREQLMKKSMSISPKMIIIIIIIMLVIGYILFSGA